MIVPDTGQQAGQISAQNKLIETIQSKEEPTNTKIEDFKNQEPSDSYGQAMYYKGIASRISTKVSKPKGNYGKLDRI